MYKNEQVSLEVWPQPIILVDTCIYNLFYLIVETDGKIDKIEDFLRTIEDRLETLKGEKEELKEYQKWDKMRRALEFAVYDRDLKDTKKKLDDVRSTFSVLLSSKSIDRIIII